MSDPSPPAASVEPAPRALWRRVSLVWLAPLLALAVTLGVAWRSYQDRGPLIEVSFEAASGVRAGETVLRYRDVTVGLVESVSFAPGLERVVVGVRLDHEIAPYVDDDAAFWVVQPQVTAQGVSGLETVLSGVYIEGVWDTAADGLVYEHVGLVAPPLLEAGQQGLRIILSATGRATLTEATPIFHRGIVVGRIGPPRLTADGGAAEAEAVIFAPHDRLITSLTRFWDISGLSFTLGPTGAQLDLTSIASLVAGGVTFDTFVSGGEAVADGRRFDLFRGETAARNSLFANTGGPTLDLAVVFEDNVPGLAVGAPVELGGLDVGEVAGLSGLVDEARFGDRRARLFARLAIRPGRLGLPGETTPEAALDYLADRVAEGLRARLATASLLTGGLKVEMLEVPGAAPAEIDRTAQPHPLMPSAPSQIADVAATAEGVFERINALPIEELLESATAFLDAATALVRSDEVAAAPGEAVALLAALREMAEAPETRGLPTAAAALLAELNGAAADLRRLLAEVEAAEAVDRLVGAVNATAAAAEAARDSLEGLPALVEALNDVARKAEALPLEALIAQTTDTLATAEALLGAEDAATLPAALVASLDELRQILAELRAAGVAGKLNDTLASADRAAAAVAGAAGDLPVLVRRMDALLVQAERTLQGLGPGSELNRDARAALREVQNAAGAVSSLARALERRPNSLIIGR